MADEARKSATGGNQRTCEKGVQPFLQYIVERIRACYYSWRLLLLSIIKIMFFYDLVKSGGKCCAKAEAFVVVVFLIMALKAEKHRFGQVLSV